MTPRLALIGVAPLPFIRVLLIILAMAVATVGSVSPAPAHTDHKKAQQQAAAVDGTSTGTTRQAAGELPSVSHSSMGEMMDDMQADRSSMTTFGRLLDWLGRLHPIIVHFPIAFFPAALFTAIVGRRRPNFSKPVQFLVVAGGVIAPIAALLGWLDGGLSLTDTDPLLKVHRWLGTVIGVGALALAIWAARRPGEDRSFGMIAGLAVVTAAIFVQGWYGGAMVHGMDHMNW